LSGSEPFRSAVPLAAAGIACLGVIPTFGGPERPLHWAMTAGMLGFGALLWTRHRLLDRDSGFADAPIGKARLAGRSILLITAISSLIVTLIVGSYLLSGKPLAGLSVAMPLAGLSWLAAIGWKLRRLAETTAEGAGQAERPSRRPAKRDSVAPPRPSPGKSPSNGHASL